MDLQNDDRYVAISDLRVYCTWRNIKKSYQHHQVKAKCKSFILSKFLPDDAD